LPCQRGAGRPRDAYAIYGGRSSWPLIRQVDVYSFFDDAKILDRGSQDPSSNSDQAAGLGLDLDEGFEPSDVRLLVPDVQQIIIRAVQPARQREDQAVALKAGKQSLKGKPTKQEQPNEAETLPLSRPQFLEVLLRAALVLDSRASVADAFQSFADRIITRRVMLPPLSPFPRGLTLVVGEYQDTLLARRKTIREAWERFGCSLNAFKAMAQLLKLCDRSFTAKHVQSIFALAKRPTPDCRASRGRPGLSYEEFCEALTRLALVWRRTAPSDGESRDFPPQPTEGRPVRQRIFAARMEAFLAKLAERMKPTLGPSCI